MAASTHWLATASAQAVLERGGNAFDAVVAGAFVLHVVEPHLNGPGGDVPAIFVTATDPGRPRVLAGHGPAPAGATIEHYRGLGLELVPGSGALAATVPAAVDAWLLLLRDHGTWSLADVLEFAIGYARDGHPVLAAVVRTIDGVAPLFRDHWPTSAARWLPDGRPPVPGQIVTNPEYADLLGRLVAVSTAATGRGRRAAIDAARRAWRAIVGPAVEGFVAAPHRHSDGGDYAGVLIAADIAGFDATIEDPVTLQFRGHTIAKTPAWGQGPVLLQALAILDGYPDERLDPGTELGAHTILEALKLTLADRDTWYGDALDPAILAHLLSSEYAATRRELIGDTASAEFRPGAVPGRNSHLPPLRTTHDTSGAPVGSLPGSPAGGPASAVGEPTMVSPSSAIRGSGAIDTDDLPTDANGVARGDTCHIDVVDRWGNMISATPSGGWLQSSPAIPGLGFCLGTRLQMAWLDKESSSSLEPGRRPRTTLSPTLVLADGHPVLACGTPGGDQQDQWQLNLLLRVLVGGYSAQQAIDAPTFHSTSLPASFWPRTWTPAGAVVEDRLGSEVIAGLEARGHLIERAGDWTLGRLSAVIRDPATGVLGAAANPRAAQGYATGR
ncbi:MAG: gamma-glutamyltransferase [Propionibacteriaceae bacterium]|nr:gamma-glutamyltransferase [Propionibacteriaceae bacterium]